MTLMAATVLPNRLIITQNAGKTSIHFAENTTELPHAFILHHPDRLVIDLKNTRIKSDFHTFSLQKTPILHIRIGFPRPGFTRLVFDLKYPIKVVPSTIHHRMTWALQPLAPQKELKITPSKVSLSHSKLIIIIDPGHGGHDPGALGPHGIAEKNVVLQTAQYLAYLINQNPSLHAVLTRNGDYFVSLSERLRIARKNKADLFVAIHADSFFNKYAEGASVYALSHHGATSVAARWLAIHENHSELNNIALGELDDQSYVLRSVLIDLAQTATIRDSLYLANSLLSTLQKVTRLHYRRVEQAPFMVLKSPDIPSILVEIGFLSNPKEESRLRDSSYQHTMAAALYRGICLYRAAYTG